ncbi:universal stress protein [Amycolatopsis iheyensis]
MFVVGKHTHGKLVRLVLRSVGDRAARHSHCPVAII